MDHDTNSAARDLLDVLRQRIGEDDRAGAVTAALDAVTSGAITVPELYASVLGPLLVGVGASWQAGETPVWREHLATSIVRTIVEALYPEVARRRGPQAPGAKTVIIACPPEEAHDLGIRMLADRFELAGWRVVFLGADTPEAELAAAATDLPAHALVLSTATHFHRLRLRGLVDRIRERLPDLRVWVGGAAFAADHYGWHEDELLDPEALFADTRRAAEEG